MENAANALTMAAGILIAVLILSLAVYLFVNLGNTSASINEQNANQQIAQINSKYLKYESYKEGSLYKNLSTIYDAITVIGYARENNKYYSDSLNNDEVIVNLNGKQLSNIKVFNDSSYEKEKLNAIKNDKDEMDNHNLINLPQYKCIIDEYYQSGKIKKINFIKL